MKKPWETIGKVLCGFLLAASVIISSAIGMGFTASADTGRPDMGKIVGFECGGRIASKGFIPFFLFKASLQTPKSTVLRVTTNNRWTPLQASGVHVWVNNIPQTPLLDTTNVGRQGLDPGLYYLLPAWDGVSGTQPKAGVIVSNRDGTEEISFSLSYSLDGEFEPLAVGMTAEPECTATSNPRP